jgi:hypothetical protein
MSSTRNFVRFASFNDSSLQTSATLLVNEVERYPPRLYLARWAS